MRMLKMSKLLSAIATLAFALATSASDFDIRPPAPEFSLPGSTHGIKLSDYKGKVVYLDFWASWCGPCKKSFPWMNAMQAKFGAQGFSVIAVNLDTNPEDSRQFLKVVAANFDIAFDVKGDVAKLFQIKGMPSSVLIDREGRIVIQHAGFNDDSSGKLELIIKNLMLEK